MKTDDLRASILQAAIQGKLTKQDPNDEPASVLVERIRDEKHRLVKEGKIKREKNESFIFKRDGSWLETINGKDERCIDDEIPFEIPDSWTWVRLASISQLISDGVHKTPQYVDSGIPFLSIQNISKGYFDLSSVKYITKDEYLQITHNVRPSLNDILVCRIGTLGKAITVTFDYEFAIFVSLALIRLVDYKLNDYFVLCFNSDYGSSWIKTVKVGGGTHTNKINLSSFYSFLVPLPPAIEQTKIITKVSDYERLLTQYHSLDANLSRIVEELPTRLTASILQAAIQGKLTKQNPDDEPASVLVERIREEKHRLVKEGKIKREKNESFIFKRDGSWFETINGKNERCIDDEIPFEIPKNWVWTRLGFLTKYGKNVQVSSSEIVSGSYVVELEDIEKNTGRIIKLSSVSECKDSNRNVFRNGNILYSKLRPYLNKVAIPDFDGFCSSEIMVLDVPSELSSHYLQIVLMSPFFVNYATSKSYGTKMPRLGTEDGRNALIPIPPMDEQKRVVDYVKQILNHVNTLKKI